MPTKIELSIEARDNATATLRGVRQELALFDQYGRQVSDLSQKFDTVERSVSSMDISVGKAVRGIRGLTVPLISELSPALGQTAGGMGQVISSALLLSSGVTAVGIAASGVAGVLGGALIENMKKATAQAEELRKIEHTLDFQTLTTGAAAARTRVTELGDQLERLSKLQRDIATSPAAGGRASGYATGAIFGTDPNIQGSPAAERNRLLQEWIASGRRAEDFFRGRQASSFAEAENVVAPEAEASFTANQLDASRRLSDIQKQVAEVAILDPIERAFQAAVRDADRALQAAPGAEGAELRQRMITLAAAQRDEALRQRRIAFAKADVANYDESLAFAPTPEALLEAGQQAGFIGQRFAFQGREAAPEPGIEDVTDFEALAPQIGVGDSTLGRARRSISDADIRDNQRMLQIDRDRITLLSQRTDLSLSERAALDAQAIQADYLLKKEQARGDAAKEFAAEVDRAVALQALLERTDPIAGLRRGLADVETEFGSMGTRMQEAVRQVGDDVGRSLSDAIAGPLEERLKSLPPLLQGVLGSFLRAGADLIGKQLVAQLFGGFNGLLGGGGSPGILPFGSGGSPLGLAAAPSAPTSVILNVNGRPLPESELRVAYNAAGDQGVQALRSGQATVVGGQYIPETFDLPGFSTGPSALAVQAPTRGFLSTALPIAGNAAAFGLTAAGATGATSPFDVGVSAALGAFTGAGLGRSIGNLFDAGSSGAGIGALAGAAINGTIAALAKQAADEQAAKQRQLAEIQRAAGAGSDLVESAGQAQSLPDFFRRLTAFGSGYTGGSANPAVITSVQTPQGRLSIGAPNPTYPVATLSDLLAAPESLQASIQAGVDPNALAGPNASTSQALQSMAADLVKQFRTTEQGVGVTEEDLLPGTSGLRRRTTVPASRAAALGSDGGPLQVDQLPLNALSEDDKAALLMDLNQVAVNRDIVSTISDGATGQIVSITRIPKSTIGLPPATTPPPAPVTSPGTVGQIPPVSTGDLLTAGGALTLGLASSLANPQSLLNQLLPAGFTGQDLANAIKNLVTTGSLSGAAGSVTIADLQAQGEGLITNWDVGADQASTGLGTVLGGAQGLSGLYGLVQGIQANDPAGIIKGLFDLYSGVSSIVPNAVSGLGTLAANAFTAIAPETATALVQAAGGTVAGSTATGAELAAALAPAAGMVLAGAAPIIAGLLTWATTQKMSDLRDWAVIGQVASQLQTQAVADVGQALQLFTALKAQGVTDPSLLKRAITVGSNALLSYYQTAQGPAGPISLADFYKRTGQDPKPLQDAVAQLQQYMVDATAYLSGRGVSYAELGALGNPDFVQQTLRAPVAAEYEQGFYAQNAALYNAQAQDLIARGLAGATRTDLPLYQGGGEGEVPTGSYATFYQDASGRLIDLSQLTPERLLIASRGAAEQAPDSVTHASGLETAKFGGPLWAMFAKLNMQNLTANAWTGTGPAQPVGVQYDPWAVLRTMTPQQLAILLADMQRAAGTSDAGGIAEGDAPSAGIGGVGNGGAGAGP